jgi:hypothetical protein
MKDLLGGIRNPFSRAGNAPRSGSPELPPKPQSETMRSAFHAFANSGLFLKDWYLSIYRDVAEANQDPLRHFLEAGWKEGRKPNPLFDPLWYLARNPDASASGMNPLFHYWMLGEKHNRQPSPLFETDWYRERYEAEIGAGARTLSRISLAQ